MAREIANARGGQLLNFSNGLLLRSGKGVLLLEQAPPSCTSNPSIRSESKSIHASAGSRAAGSGAAISVAGSRASRRLAENRVFIILGAGARCGMGGVVPDIPPGTGAGIAAGGGIGAFSGAPKDANLPVASTSSSSSSAPSSCGMGSMAVVASRCRVHRLDLRQRHRRAAKRLIIAFEETVESFGAGLYPGRGAGCARPRRLDCSCGRRVS